MRRRGWAMAVWQCIPVGLVLVAAAGCTRAPSAPDWTGLSVPPARASAPGPRDLEPAPWSRLARVSAADPLMVDPFAALLRSAADRRRWAGQRPIDYSTLVWKPGGPDPLPPGERSSPPVDSLTVLSRLDKALSVSVKPICRGC